jgi:hypothetical protein
MIVTNKYFLTKHVIIHNDNEQEYDIKFALVKLDQGSVDKIRECMRFAQYPHINRIDTNLITCNVFFLDSERDEDKSFWFKTLLGQDDQIGILEEQFKEWGWSMGVDTINHGIRIYDDGFLFYADMKHSDIELETKLFNLKDFD